MPRRFLRRWPPPPEGRAAGGIGPQPPLPRPRPEGAGAVVIGEVVASPAKRVLLRTDLGSTRVVEMLMGELLPRIC